MICELCEKELHAFDLQVQDLLQGVCLNCGKAGDWPYMSPAESKRCQHLYTWANMTEDQRKAYDRDRGS